MFPREPIPAADVDTGNMPDISMGAGASPDKEREVAWPMDTDTDTPFKYDSRNGKLRLWPRVQDQHMSGASTPIELKDSPDPLRSPARRRRWTAHLLVGDELERGAARTNEDFGLDTSVPLPEEDSVSVASAPPGRPSFMKFAHLPSGVLRSLRERSFRKLSLPFKSPHDKGKGVADQQQDVAWSSDSSELEEELNLPEGDFPLDEEFQGPVLSSSREL